MIHSLLSEIDLQNHPIMQSVILLLRKLRLTVVIQLVNDLEVIKSTYPEGQFSNLSTIPTQPLPQQHMDFYSTYLWKIDNVRKRF